LSVADADRGAAGRRISAGPRVLRNIAQARENETGIADLNAVAILKRGLPDGRAIHISAVVALEIANLDLAADFLDDAMVPGGGGDENRNAARPAAAYGNLAAGEGKDLTRHGTSDTGQDTIHEDLYGQHTEGVARAQPRKLPSSFIPFCFQVMSNAVTPLFTQTSVRLFPIGRSFHRTE